MKKLVSVFFLAILQFASISNASLNYVDTINATNWNEAKKFKDTNLNKLTNWLLIINDQETSFYKITSFIENNQNWPQMEALLRKVEESDFSTAKKDDILEWFKKHPTKNYKTRIKLLNLTQDKNLITQIWHENSLSLTEEREFFRKYIKFLDQKDMIKRIEHMLFNHQTSQATRTLSYLPKNQKKLYEISIKLQQIDSEGLTEYLKLNSEKQNDIGLLHNLAHYYEAKKDENNLIKTLDKATKLFPNKQYYFWNMKAKLIRNLIEEKNFQTAYLFSKSHEQIAKADLSEAEWLAGWIALRFLNEPTKAINHFLNVHKNVKKPISVSRAAYWLGRSYEKLNRSQDAQNWYKIASKYYISFYGQLSICKLSTNCNFTLPSSPQIDQQAETLFANNPLVIAAKVLERSKYNALVPEFLKTAIDNSESQGEIYLITKYSFEIEQKHVSVEMAKQASYKDVHVIEHAYPTPNYVFKDHPLDISLVYSLIRQESVFNHKAVSSAGARGLMQIMPHVAKETAKKNKITYNLSKLSNDPYYNSLLGVSHLKTLVEKYNGSYILAIAAYNAGDRPVLSWIEKNGDPRTIKTTEEIVDWLEKINYYETRNYVQRVLEGKTIYSLLFKKTNRLDLEEDIKR